MVQALPDGLPPSHRLPAWYAGLAGRPHTSALMQTKGSGGGKGAMLTAKISSKGQISLPKEVREALGLSAGDRVVFSVEGGSATLLPLRVADHDE